MKETILAILFIPCVAIAAPADKQDIQELSVAVRDLEQLTSVGHDSTAQSLVEAFTRLGLKDAADAIPNLAQRLEDTERDRYNDAQKIAMHDIQISLHGKQLVLIEERSNKQQEAMGVIKTGVVVALDKLSGIAERWEQITGAFYTLICLVIVAALKFAAEKMAGKNKGKKKDG